MGDIAMLTLQALALYILARIDKRLDDQERVITKLEKEFIGCPNHVSKGVHYV